MDSDIIRFKVVLQQVGVCMSIPIYILKRLLAAIPTMVIISMISFFMMRYDFTIGPVDIPTGGGQAIHLMDAVRIKNPINPLAGIEGNPQISEAAKAHARHMMGLDQPMYVQYWRWVTNLFDFHPGQLARGSFAGFWTPSLGTTFSGEDVIDILIERGRNTLLLNVVVLMFSWLIAIPLGIHAALHWRSMTDRMMTVLAAVGMSFPSFVLALILAVFAVQTNLFPLGGLYSEHFASLNIFQKIIDVAQHLTLPAVVLTIGALASIQRQMRGNLLDVLAAEYVRTARAKGLPEHKVIYKHAVRTAINPLVTMMGYELAGLLGGAILVEKVLNYPGLGQLAYKAAIETDTNLVMATLMTAALLLIVGNLLADILLKVIDPRIELE
jgi:peptide/nickel transport system permease protein